MTINYKQSVYECFEGNIKLWDCIKFVNSNVQRTVGMNEKL